MLLCCHLTCDDALTPRAAALCRPGRRQRALRLPTLQAQAAGLAAGLLLELALGRWAASPDGKTLPFFSLSHSGEWAACALAPVPVGVDVQRFLPVDARLPHRVCSQKEREWLSQSADWQRDFIRLWALKESWLKAAGGSLSDLKNTSFSLQSSQIIGPAGCEFELGEALSGYALAVCRKTMF